MYTLVNQVLGFLQQFTGQNDGGSRSIPTLCVLGLSHFHYHLGCWMLHVNLLEDGDTIVGDDNVPHRVHEHLIHALGTQGGPHRICNGFGSGDVVGLGFLIL